MQLAGLSGAPVIQQFVQYLKTEWKLPTPLAPVAAIASGVTLNIGLASYLHNGMQESIVIGLLTGLFACGWHEIAKKS